MTLSALLLATTAFAQDHTHYEERYATHPQDVQSYDTQRLRSEFLVEDLLQPDKVNMIYTHHDRMIIGGAEPVSQGLKLETIDPIKSAKFTEHREVGVINIGGKGYVTVGNQRYDLNHKDALYIGRGNEDVTFYSESSSDPAIFYFNSATAHATYPTKKISKQQAPSEEIGSEEEASAGTITRYIIPETVQSSQLTLGMTELKKGNVWNTMPPHIHGRRMEAYFYIDLPEGETVAHFMGEQDKTKNIWVHNRQGVISPAWSLHSGVGTSSHSIIWGMAGENQDYLDKEEQEKQALK